MREGSRTLVGLVVAFLVVAGAVIGVAVLADLAGAQAADNGTADGTGQVADNGTGPYDLEDLNRNGAERTDAPDSVRKWGSTGSLWIRYAQTSAFDRLVDDDELKTYLESGQTVRRDYLYVGGFRGWSADAESLTLYIVYWENGEIERQTEDGIVREDAAVNQRVDRVEVEFSGNGYEEHRIGLRDHYDDASRVTMWVEGEQGRLQWTFRQQSSRAADSFPVDSRGDFVLYGFLFLILPAGVVGGGGTYLARRWLKRAGAGPMYDPELYVGTQIVVLVLVALFAWDWIREVVATAPWLLGIVLGVNIVIFALELFGDRARKVLVMQLFDVANAEDLRDGTGNLPFEAEEAYVVDLEGGTGIIKPGIRPFLARSFGAVPTLEALGDTAKTSLTSHDSPWAELYLISPYAEELLDHDAEKWVLDVLDERPEDSRLPEWLPVVDVFPIAIAATFPILGFVLGKAVVSSGLIGLTVGAIAGLFFVSTPTAGPSTMWLAPIHFDDVLRNVLMTVEGLEEAADAEWYREKWHEAEGSNLARRKNEQEESEVTRFEKVVENRREDAGRDRPERDPSAEVSPSDD